jgi:hypothetical protein
MKGQPFARYGGPGMMGNVRGEADRGQIDPFNERLCDQLMAEDQEPLTSGTIPVMAALRFELGVYNGQI